MKRDIIKIDEELCNGCGACVKGCHEGALQMIDGKARIVSELYCDGLGACIGECPVGAIEIESREAEPYSETAVMERIAPKGEATILAHLRHLKDHGETLFLKQGVDYVKANNLEVDLTSVDASARQVSELSNDIAQPFLATKPAEKSSSPMVSEKSSSTLVSEKSLSILVSEKSSSPMVSEKSSSTLGSEKSKMACGCPGSMERSFVAPSSANFAGSTQNAPTAQSPHSAQSQQAAQSSYSAQAYTSQLTHWPVQLHLLNPQAGYFRGADVVIAADCTAYAYPDFHNRFIKGKTLAIACPKLDSNKESYVARIAEMIDSAHINTLTVVIMEVPCCGGLMQLAMKAAEQAVRKVPIKKVVIGVQGEIMSESWI